MVPNWADSRRLLVGAAVLTGERRLSCHMKLLTALSFSFLGGRKKGKPTLSNRSSQKIKSGVGGGGGGVGTQFHLLFSPQSSPKTDPVTSLSGKKPSPCCLFLFQHLTLFFLLIFGCAGSSLLGTGFLHFQRAFSFLEKAQSVY